MTRTAALFLLFLLCWRMLVLGTCAYVVFWQGHSGWWFLLAILLCSGDISEKSK